MTSSSSPTATLPLQDDLIRTIREYSPETDVSAIRRACEYIRKIAEHQGSRLTPALVDHALNVALILAGMRVDVLTILAGILHVAVEENTTARFREISKQFGDEVRFLVENTTNVARMEFHVAEEEQMEKFRKMLLSMSQDIRVIMILFSDQLHTMREIDRFEGAERFRIARETLDIYAPLANRLGIGWLRIEFEDLAFKSLLPREYADLDKRVALQRDELQTYIDGVIGLVRPRIEAQGIQARISGRVKHSYSIYQKLKRQNIPFEKVYDVMGVRIITETQGECYAVLGLLHGMFTPVPGRLKDFIGAPKSNGYQSLQTTVIGPKGRRVEFQIRTRDMNEVAEKGVAAHWRYKEKEPLSEKDQQVFDSLRRLIQDYKDLQDSRDFLDSVKGDLFSHVVYVFTPDGDLKELPTGATPIDLAYAVHSEVGNRCTGARVNGRIVPLRHELRNGDTVEIITHPGHVPSRDWLKIAKTSKAKNRIRAFIRAEERNQSRALGLQLIEEEMRKHHINPKLLKGERLEEGAASVGFKTSEDLLVSVGYGRFSAHQVVNRLFTDLLKEKAEAAAERVVPSRPEDRKGVRVTGIDNLLYHFSKCCFPLPGDAIVGFVTRGKGVAIHTRDCPNLHMMSVDTDRLIRVEWEGGAEQSHPVRVEVRSKDKPGMLASITASLSAEKVNIERLESGRSRDDTAYYHFVLEVRNKAHLDEVIRKLNQVSGVLEVHRVGTAG